MPPRDPTSLSGLSGTGQKNKGEPMAAKEYRAVHHEARGWKLGVKYKCELCTVRRGVDIHHIRNNYRGRKDNSPDNLILVCRKCHELIHQNNTRDKRQQLLALVRAKIGG